MMTVAEYFRDRGRQVLLLADSITRFAEAQREIAAAAGEPFGPSGFPASMAQMVMGLAERAGPGATGQGDITAVLSVLVAGSDMEGPVADVMRGVLDGHVLLDREIAERGRYPAIDLLRSVSRALPGAVSAEELRLIGRARQLLGAHDRSEMMIRAGLYSAGKRCGDGCGRCRASPARRLRRCAGGRVHRGQFSRRWATSCRRGTGIGAGWPQKARATS